MNSCLMHTNGIVSNMLKYAYITLLEACCHSLKTNKTKPLFSNNSKVVEDTTLCSLNVQHECRLQWGHAGVTAGATARLGCKEAMKHERGDCLQRLRLSILSTIMCLQTGSYQYRWSLVTTKSDRGERGKTKIA